MLPFKDIFVIQIIGLLVERRFSGECNLRLNGKPHGQLSFAQGHLVGARHGNQVEGGALNALIWLHEGEIDLVPRAYPASDWDYVEALDKVITESCPPMPDACPFMKYLNLAWGKLNPQEKSDFKMIGLTIFGNVHSSGSDVVRAQWNMPDHEFWQGLFHLFGTGQIQGDYGVTLSPLLLSIQNNVVSNLQKLLGKRTADLYQERLNAELAARRADWAKNKAYDPIYGTAPYLTWMALIRETIARVASSALGSACYRQALAKLTPNEAEVLHASAFKHGGLLP